MAASVENSRIVHPHPVPSLFRLASVRVSVSLWNSFGFQALHQAIRRIKLGISTENGQNIAQENLLYIPEFLRKSAYEAIYGLWYGAQKWITDHHHVIELKDELFTFYWRQDGTVDRIKVAERLVMNPNMDIRKRFRLASMYCLETSIQILWAEMEASGKTENITPPYCFCSMVPFWVARMRNGVQMPWVEAAVQCVDSFLASSIIPGIAWGYFFPLLSPRERKRFLCCLEFCQLDDLRLCLYEMSEEEEKETLKKLSGALNLLELHFEWPHRHLFLETAKKTWKYMSEHTFQFLLKGIIKQKKVWEDFYYFEFFETFWNICPKNYRENVREGSEIRRNIDSILNEAKKIRLTMRGSQEFQ